MVRVLITGGTGLVGSSLTKALLLKNYEVIILTRGKANSSSDHRVTYAHWDVKNKIIDRDAITTTDFIIHLAGAGIAEKRWTKKRKDEIRESRVDSAKLLVECLKNFPNRVRALISASGIGWYGTDPLIPNPRPFEENDPPSPDFLGQTCLQWEKSLEPVIAIGKRLVILRTGIVLTKKGGALREFLKPLRLGIATILGSGKQIISWIHIDDLVNIYIAAIENELMNGAYNTASPVPVSNKTLTIELARSRRKFYLPLHVPSFVLRAVLGEMSIEILKSTTVSTEKILRTGFIFRYPTLAGALQHV